MTCSASRHHPARFALVALWAPALAWAAPPPVEDYGKLPVMEHVTLSPSGQRYAFVTTAGDQRRLIVATVANQPVDAMTVGKTKIEALEWAGEDHLLVHTSSTVELGMDFAVSKTELAGVTAVNLATHKAIPIFGNPYQKRVAHTVVGSYGSARIGDHWYGYFGGYTYDYDAGGGGAVRKDSDGVLYPDLYRVDLDTGEIAEAAAGQSRIRDWLVAPSGEVVARLYYDERSGDWRLRRAKAGGPDLASGRSPTERVSVQGFGRTAQSVLIHIGGADHDVYEEAPLDGTAPKTYNADETGSPLFDPVTSLWIGEQDEEDPDASRLYAPTLEAKRKGAFKAFPGYMVRLVSYSADFNHMIVFTDGKDDSGSYWIVDIAKGSADVIGQAYPSVHPENVGPVRWVDYKAADGLEMHGVLTLPPGREAKALPLVVMPHGGPEAHDSPGFDWWAQAFAARGYAVFQPNYRGSTGSGNKFRDAGFGQWGRKMQTDISDGVAELAKQGIVDPKRACIVGGSYGGYAALAGVTVQHGLYQCAVSYGGVADLAAMLRYERERTGGFSATTRYWKEFMGATTAFETELNDISPIHLADHADAPILLIHGKDDTVVTIDQSQSMERALTRAGKPVELVTFPGTDHWLLQEDSRVAMLKASVGFVMKHNPPDEPAAKGP